MPLKEGNKVYYFLATVEIVNLLITEGVYYFLYLLRENFDNLQACVFGDFLLLRFETIRISRPGMPAGQASGRLTRTFLSFNQDGFIAYEKKCGTPLTRGAIQPRQGKTPDASGCRQ